jgi:predicted transposase YbfD/YdcC
MGVIRSHWGIENSVHWVLDVVFERTRVASDATTAGKT